MEYSREDIFSYMLSKKYSIFEKGDYNLNIIAIRNSEKKNRSIDEFDDKLFIFYKIKDNWIKEEYEVTTYPGLTELKNPSFTEAKRNGTAIIVPNQYRSAYKLGWHYNQEGLIQVKPIKIYRDNNRDVFIDKFEYSVIEGMFGCNIHGTSPQYQQNKVLNWSAGCIVIRYYSKYMLFLKTIKEGIKNFGNSFTLTLIESDDLNKFILENKIIV